jgi:hypothetical protein
MIPYAHKWINFGIDRKITKRPVMVLPYGGTFTSCRGYVRAAVEERGCPDFGSCRGDLQGHPLPRPGRVAVHR